MVIYQFLTKTLNKRFVFYGVFYCFQHVRTYETLAFSAQYHSCTNNQFQGDLAKFSKQNVGKSICGTVPSGAEDRDPTSRKI